MSNMVLMNKINETLQRLNTRENSIIVLKGIPLNVIDQQCDIRPVEEVIKNKLAYFVQIYQNRRYITYEEFLMLNSFILDQYENVVILNNNLYISQYPIDASYSDTVRSGLLNHFTDSENDYDDSEIGNIDEIIDLYDGLKEYNDFLIGSYCEDKIPNDNKIQTINLFDYESLPIRAVDYPDNSEVLDIQEESDYIELVKKVFSEPDEVYIRVTNYSGDVDRLNDHISILRKNWADFTDIYYIQPQEVSTVFEHRDDFSRILKKYWGYDSFRSFDVYDMKKLEDGKKETVKVSQEQIISDLVQQAENCADSNSEVRDVFVTAPTGAGKSVIFQIPAIYLAEKEEPLLTIVISPLIGLMNDQVLNLEKRNYKAAKTINSDISPIVKEDILQKVQDGEYHILYLSPETLLARSTVEQLIGDRTIGMIIIDEAHIVTTWGKQFRPDYWYLGDHIRKLRSNQIKKKGRSFVIGTFTATAIYHGIEDMYEETRNSLHMIDPIVYLGYMKRNDININIDTSRKPKGEREEYGTDKLDQLVNVIKRARITGKKTLIYFPTVNLIEECYQYIDIKGMSAGVTKYYGPLKKDIKNENYHAFYNGEKPIMLATKAFGMGIDIDNIELVVHYAPTGNVCDYVQEIGRAARRKDLEGEAYYHYHPRDFKFINRFHGLSSIKKYQLVEVVKKIDELYQINRRKNINSTKKKKNAMLIAAENFTYIFDNPMSEGDDNVNKVKTALLIIQKDFEAKIGFSPITVRPIPLFSIGFFAIEPMTQKSLLKSYKNCLEEINTDKHICRVNLESIWNKDYTDKSFPQFKYLLYNKDPELKINQYYTLNAALCVDINFANDYYSIFRSIWGCFKKIAHDGTITQEYIPFMNFVNALQQKCGIKKYKAMAICEVVFSSMDIYRRKYSHGLDSIFKKSELQSGEVKYQFKVAINSYFSWVEKGLDKIQTETREGSLYLINNGGQQTQEISTILGIMEAMDVLTFEMSGGADSQLYIYVNQIRNLKAIIDRPEQYKNRLLETVSERHLISVKMFTYLYEGGFTNEQIWDILEDYFLGKIPERVKANCKRENPNIRFE